MDQNTTRSVTSFSKTTDNLAFQEVFTARNNKEFEEDEDFQRVIATTLISNVDVVLEAFRQERSGMVQP